MAQKEKFNIEKEKLNQNYIQKYNNNNLFEKTINSINENFDNDFNNYINEIKYKSKYENNTFKTESNNNNAIMNTNNFNDSKVQSLITETKLVKKTNFNETWKKEDLKSNNNNNLIENEISSPIKNNDFYNNNIIRED